MDEPQRPRTPAEIDRAQHDDCTRDAGAAYARKGRPSPAWTWLGVPVMLAGLALLVWTWGWKNGSIGRYGVNWQLNACGVVFLGALMVIRGRRGRDGG